MLPNLAIVLIVAMFFSYLFDKIKLPPLLGMITAGMLLSPNTKKILDVSSSFFDHIFISDELMDLSGEFRTAALIVILIRAGLGINRSTLNKIGGLTIKLAFIPAILEILFLSISAYYLLNFSYIQSLLLASVIAAVSPAVIVPQMLNLKDMGYGKKKEIPTLILASASLDDIFAITLFGIFLNIAMESKVNIISAILSIPISIISGVFLGLIVGKLLVTFFKKYHIRDSKKVIIFFSVAILLYHLEDLHIFPFAALVSIMSIGFFILETYDILAKRLALKFNKLWVLAELLLFVSIGAIVDIRLILHASLVGVLIVIIGLVARSIGVFISLHSSNLNFKEKIFCIFAYIPKATVQAAIGSIPLSYGIQHGDNILAMAVLSIIIAAPLGALTINFFHDKLLDSDKDIF